MEGRTRELCYAVDEKGNYVKVLSCGWGPKNAALLQAWEQINEDVKAAYLSVKEGKASPLAFYMARSMFDVALLSAYTGIPKRKIRVHLDPEAFRNLDSVTLGKYAEVFDVPVGELVTLTEAVLAVPWKQAAVPTREDPRRDGDE